MVPGAFGVALDAPVSPDRCSNDAPWDSSQDTNMKSYILSLSMQVISSDRFYD